MKKRRPREGTKTRYRIPMLYRTPMKKRRPREGTKTSAPHAFEVVQAVMKKRRPREGTKTLHNKVYMVCLQHSMKKRRPREGTKTILRLRF